MTCRQRVWWPDWVGGYARVWQASLVALGWPLLLWGVGSSLFWLAEHTLRLTIAATAFGWLGLGCSAAAVLLPFVGGGLLLAAAFRAAPAAADRAAALGVPAEHTEQV